MTNPPGKGHAQPLSLLHSPALLRPGAWPMPVAPQPALQHTACPSRPRGLVRAWSWPLSPPGPSARPTLPGLVDVQVASPAVARRYSPAGCGKRAAVSARSTLLGPDRAGLPRGQAFAAAQPMQIEMALSTLTWPSDHWGCYTLRQQERSILFSNVFVWFITFKCF